MKVRIHLGGLGAAIKRHQTAEIKAEIEAQSTPDAPKNDEQPILIVKNQRAMIRLPSMAVLRWSLYRCNWALYPHSKDGLHDKAARQKHIDNLQWHPQEMDDVPCSSMPTEQFWQMKFRMPDSMIYLVNEVRDIYQSIKFHVGQEQETGPCYQMSKRKSVSIFRR